MHKNTLDSNIPNEELTSVTALKVKLFHFPQIRVKNSNPKTQILDDIEED